MGTKRESMELPGEMEEGRIGKLPDDSISES